jgi:DNA-binding NarL/FixJ family response regulator
VLVLDHDYQHAEHLSDCLRSHNLGVDVCADPATAVARLLRNAPDYEVVIINISGNSAPRRKALQKVYDACNRVDARQAPLFLCVSTVHQQPDFVLQIERMGARYVRER